MHSGGHYSRKSPEGTCLDTKCPYTSQPAPFPRERSICFPCRPDLWTTLFFICLHKLSRVTCFFPQRVGCCQHLRVTGQVTCLRKKRLQEVTWEPVAGTNLAWLQVTSLGLKRAERKNGNPVWEVQHPHLSEVRAEMWHFIQHGTSRGD